MPVSQEEATTKQVRVWANAFDAVQELQELYASEKGMPNVTLTEAASLAILEALERRRELQKVAGK